jgi:hypothetical protein
LTGGVRIGELRLRVSGEFGLYMRYLYGASTYFLVIKRMSKPAENLPDDPAVLKAMIAELQAENAKITATVPGHGFETARCAGYAAILTPVAASGSRAFCSALI